MATGDGPDASYWEFFGNKDIFSEVLHEKTGSIAEDVLQELNVPHVSAGIGGPLKNLDIKLMDPLSVIKLSLMEYFANSGVFYEPIVNTDGNVEFVSLGKGNPSLDIYRTIHSNVYNEKVCGVLVQAGRPIPERKGIEWKPVWGSTKEIIETDQFMTCCMRDKIKQYSLIVFDDPHLSTSYEDGIDNFYEINQENPYDVMLGWAYWLNPGDNVDEDTNIDYVETCELPILVGKSLGTLKKPPSDPNDDVNCLEGQQESADPDDGVKIPLSSSRRFETVRGVMVDKFIKVTGVYVVGYKLKRCYGQPKNPKAGTGESSSSNTDVKISFSSTRNSIFKLNEGTNYVIAFEEFSEGVPKEPHIVFANQSRKNDNGRYGDNSRAYVLNCSVDIPDESKDGYKISDEGYIENINILPIGGVEGIAVKEVWATVAYDSPAIVIHDPAGKAEQIAEDLKFDISPLVVTNEPAPYAYNGLEVDLIQGKADHDPTTRQDFYDTELEIIKDELANGNGVAVTYSFMDINQAKSLSTRLADLLDKGVGTESVHVCGPNTEVELGQSGNSGGIINSINYSYSDGGSYTISVTEGPWMAASLGGISSSFYVKQTESQSMGGVIVQDLGNHINYKVLVDGFGDVAAINCSKSILRVGDRVNCTVHNIPVEE